MLIQSDNTTKKTIFPALLEKKFEFLQLQQWASKHSQSKYNKNINCSKKSGISVISANITPLNEKQIITTPISKIEVKQNTIKVEKDKR